jgi:chemotaxis protein methyltransferase CheR
MIDSDCVTFLQWALPQLHMRWPGFRKVRRTVCGRVSRRMRCLDLDGIDNYRAYLETHPDEWVALDAMCRIPISRFYRDRGVWATITEAALPRLAIAAAERGDRIVRAWSAGCASGEEPCTLRLAWNHAPRQAARDVGLEIVATDIDETMLARARRGCYARSSLKDVPADWLADAFEERNGEYCLRPPVREGIEFRRQDIRRDQPPGPFDLILCRHLLFTYFDAGLQQSVGRAMLARLREGGLLVAGKQESIPAAALGLAAWRPHSGIYGRAADVLTFSRK